MPLPTIIVVQVHNPSPSRTVSRSTGAVSTRTCVCAQNQSAKLVFSAAPGGDQGNLWCATNMRTHLGCCWLSYAQATKAEDECNWTVPATLWNTEDSFNVLCWCTNCHVVFHKLPFAFESKYIYFTLLVLPTSPGIYPHSHNSPRCAK